MAHVLIVDDDPYVRSTLIKVFRKEPYEILEASNGREAVQCCQQNPVDVMITDLIMPEKEGIETILEIRRDFKNVKIIAISGGRKNREDIYLNMAKTLGAEYVFNKPVPIGDILNAVRDLLGHTENGL